MGCENTDALEMTVHVLIVKVVDSMVLVVCFWNGFVIIDVII